MDANVPIHQQLLRMMSGYWISQMIYVAAKLGVADRLASEPRRADDLAPQLGVHPQALYRLLRGLASVGIFCEDESQRFTLTPLAECLLDRPGSQRAVALMLGETQYQAFGSLLHSVTTGKPAFDHVFGQPIFEYLAQHPEAAQVFDAAMQGVHGDETPAMLDVVDLASSKTFVDIGGGNGSVLAAVLGRYPQMEGILFDLPNVVERSRLRFEEAGLGSRCRFVGGSFWETAPSGGDTYFLRHILHDWYDDPCVSILGHIRNVIPSTGRLLIVESVVRTDNSPGFGKLLDIVMLAIPGGMERTEAEFRQLLQRAGFRVEAILPTRTEVSVLDCRPV